MTRVTIAIIGGTITATLLTMLVVLNFYDNIEITRDRAIAKFQGRSALRNPFVAFLQTLMALLLLRWIYRELKAGLILGRSSVSDTR